MEWLGKCYKNCFKALVSFGADIRMAVSLLVLAAYMVSVSANGSCPPCLPEDMKTTSSVCQQQGVYLENSESTKNSTVVCSALHELFICIAENIPQCLDKIGSEYEHYTWKPWNCSMDEHLKQYQEVVLTGCKLKTGDYNPVKTGNQSSYKMADSGSQNSTSSGISVYKTGWLQDIISLSLGLVLRILDFSYLDV